MKKIGIITFHLASNYGAILQAYSTYTTLKMLFPEDEVFIIDYRPEFIARQFRYYKKKSNSIFKNIVTTILQYNTQIKKRHNYLGFVNKNEVLIPLNNCSELTHIVCGSDQIWNFEISDDKIDPVYFGKIPCFQGSVISYAASDGGKLKDYNGNELSDLLNNIKSISVRETVMVNIIKKYTDKPVTVNVDPIFLQSKEFWIKQSEVVKEKNFILLYRRVPDQKLTDDAKKIAKKLGLKIIEINTFLPIKDVIRNREIEYKLGISPKKFLGYINGASLILTNSFHGVAFSILFNKNFYVYKLKKRSERITDLLKLFNLENRYIEHEEYEFNNIDYTEINNILNRNRNESYCYLKENL